MSCSSSPMDCQKPVKVKSRWLQSSQMEMMIEESQSSLDMSDAITDVSTSDINESTDYSSELIPKELRKSRRNGSNKPSKKQLNGSKHTQQKRSMSPKTSTKKSRKKKQLSNTSETGYVNELKKTISHKSNIVQTSVEWNNIKHFQPIRLSKSVDCINEAVEKSCWKSIRRASLSWGFTFIPKNEVNNSIVNQSNSVSYDIKHLSLNESLIKVTSLNNDDKVTYKRSKKSKNTSQQLYNTKKNVCTNKNIDLLSNEELNVELNKISTINSIKQKEFIELNKHTIQYDEKKSYQANPIGLYLPKLKNLNCCNMSKFKKLRSKSLDSVFIHTKNTSNNFRRFKSYDCINQIEKVNVEILKFPVPQKKSPKKKRRQSKRIKPKNNITEMLDDIKVPEVNYNQVADDIYREHQNQLHEARINDNKFDEKLKLFNFTLINENVYRPNR